MDQATRNSLQNATQQARRLLEREITEQLEGAFDVLPNGTIADKPGKHLDASQRLVRTKIVESIRHRAGGSAKAEMLADAVTDYVREAAFTILNRYIALKMLEVRGLVQQCITKGDQSSGFKEFGLAATGLAQLPDKGYRLYLESLFDELSTEVKILFDRHSDASLLWPRRQAFDGLLEILNADDLGSVWKEDETIGWVYQYFNSQEERRAMRDASQAPRNSRELAVRNQFFTPRYVVEFLTDNTLGRTWYEMRQGQTALATQCRYLVRRPTEVFLKVGESVPAGATTAAEASHADLLRQRAHVLFRAKKDPRDLKILDPACGSSHFLIYCFDLLLTIYEEAWCDEASPASQVTGQALKHDYPTIESLHAAVPGLILRHNVHGIDIDARCAQIGAFALWMRAQRAYNAFNIPKDHRPAIRRSNIVVAEPMPGEGDLLKDFLRDLREDRLESIIRGALRVPTDKTVRATAAMADSLCDLVRTVWNSMKLAGEAGSLLRIDKDLEAAIAKGRSQWDEAPLFRVSQLGSNGSERTSLVRELPGGQEDFWTKSEVLVLHALRTFAGSAEQAAGMLFRRGLFADDAARGLAFIDIARTHFDILLMNPPFGEFCQGVKQHVQQTCDARVIDIYTAFMVRAVAWLHADGMAGMITNRTYLTLSGHTDIRHVLMSEKSSLTMVADLGSGVLDSAMVETAASTLTARAATPSSQLLFLPCHGVDDRHERLLELCQDVSLVTCREWRDLKSLPNAALAYWLHADIVHMFATLPPLSDTVARAWQGLITSDDFRFARLRWEVNPDHVGIQRDWTYFAKGGEFSPYYEDIHLVVNWARAGEELCSFASPSGDLLSRPQSIDKYGRLGLTFPWRTTLGFAPRVLPRGCIFAAQGSSLVANTNAEESESMLTLLGMLNSALYQVLISVGVGAVEGAAKSYQVGLVSSLPTVDVNADDASEISHLTRSAVRALWDIDGSIESTIRFRGYSTSGKTLVALEKEITDLRRESVATVLRCMHDIDRIMVRASGVDPSAIPDYAIPARVLRDRFLDETASAERILSWNVGLAFGRFRQSDLRDKEPGDPFTPLPSRAPCEAADQQSIAFLVDDPGSPLDLAGRVAAVLCDAGSGTLLEDLAERLSGNSQSPEDAIGHWIRTQFFEFHISMYSRSRRQAPVYWQLATASGAFSVWLCSPAVTKDTLFQAMSEVIIPRVKREEASLARLRAEAGDVPTPSQRRAIEAHETFIDELKVFAEEVGRVAPLWVPNRTDGILLNCAPLWRLVPQHKAWQKECKACWESLCSGEYDWSHLAMHLWPERVVPKCIADASLAIAHGLVDAFWDKDGRGKWAKKMPPPDAGKAGWQPTVDRLVADRTSRQMKDALGRLLAAPVPEGGSKRGRGARSAAKSDANGETAREGTKRKSRPSKALNESEELF